MSDTKAAIYTLLGKFAKVDGTVDPDALIFGDGLNMSSISFTEFVLKFEEDFDASIMVEDLGEEIKTAEQLVDTLMEYVGTGA